jgi:hypothetical protein
MREGSDLSYSHPGFTGYVGAARADITPPVGIATRNWLVGTHDVAQGVHRPLTLTAVSFRHRVDDMPMVLLTMDLGWWRCAEDEARLRQAVADALKVAPSHLVICLSHTHAGPCLARADADRPGGEHIGPYLDRLEAEAVATARAACEGAEPSTISFASVRCGLATNQDLPDPRHPRVICGFHPGLPADHKLLLGRVTAITGRPLVTLVNYACDLTSLGWTSALISPDWVGSMRQIVEDATGAPLAFIQGACANQAPRDQFSGAVEFVERNGRRMGYSVLAGLDGMLPPRTRLEFSSVANSDVPLALWKSLPAGPASACAALCVEVDLFMRDATTFTQHQTDYEAAHDRVAAERARTWHRLRQSTGSGPMAGTTVWAWRLGDVFLVSQPHNASVGFQTQVRSLFPQRLVMVASFANGPYFGFLPEEDAFDVGSYAAVHAVVSPGSMERVRDAAACGLRRLTL